MQSLWATPRFDSPSTARLSSVVMSMLFCNMQMALRCRVFCSTSPGCACGLSRLRVANATHPVGAGRENGRQPGNKQPLLAYERRRDGGRFYGNSCAVGSPFLWVLSFGEAKESTPPPRGKQQIKNPRSGVTRQNKVGRKPSKACGQLWSLTRGKRWASQAQHPPTYPTFRVINIKKEGQANRLAPVHLTLRPTSAAASTAHQDPNGFFDR